MYERTVLEMTWYSTYPTYNHSHPAYLVFCYLLYLLCRLACIWHLIIGTDIPHIWTTYTQ